MSSALAFILYPIFLFFNLLILERKGGEREGEGERERFAVPFIHALTG